MHEELASPSLRFWSRRQVLSAAVRVGVSSLLLPRQANADALKFAGRKIVFCGWGGFAQDAQKSCICDPFSAKTGTTVVQDGPMNNAKFLAMVEGGSPVWDVADVTIDFLYSNIQNNAFEPLDFKQIQTTNIASKYVNPHGIGTFVWSYNIGYNSKNLGPNDRPKNWADVLDLKKFPGQRSFRDRVTPMLEIALMADGVAPSALYPLDVDRAFRKLDTVKASTIWWKTNAQSQQLINDGQVNVGVIVNGRAYDVASKGGNIGIEWEQNIQSVDYWVIPKGSANVDVAHGLINEMTQPENQARLAELMAYAPTNPAAFEHIKEPLRPWLSTQPENAAKGMQISPSYWTPNLAALTERWETWKLS